MQRLNPIDAITPAFIRTHELLFRPFKVGRTWKLCASSYVGFAGGIFIPFPIFFAAVPWHHFPGNGINAVFAVFAILFTVVSLVFFYLCVRMELVNFEKVVTRAKYIAPMWRRYSHSVWPWLGLKVATGTVLSTVMAPIIITAMRHLFTTMAAIPVTAPGQPQDPALIFPVFGQMLGIYAIFIAAFFTLKFVATLLHDFVLPFYVIEQLPLLAALRRGVDVVAADPVQIVLYLGMKFILAIVGFMMQYFANLIIFIPFMIVFFFGALFAGMVHPAHGSVAFVLLIAAGVFFYALFIALTIWFQLGTFGYLLTLLDAYGIYFLAGRYPMLADILEPPAPNYTYTPPPSPPSPGEGDGGGPSLPMDPALA